MPNVSQRDGEEAAWQLFDRYTARLIGLARSRMSKQLCRKVDPEDVVQSVYRSFFRRADAGEFELNNSDELWRLLAAITVRKVQKKVRYLHAAKRSISNEVDVHLCDTNFRFAPEQLAKQPSPDEALILSEQLEQVLSALNPLHRQMIELRLQGCAVEEISREVDRTETQVRRVLKKAKDNLVLALSDIE